MKMNRKQVIVYTANDGTEFYDNDPDAKERCLEHEQKCIDELNRKMKGHCVIQRIDNMLYTKVFDDDGLGYLKKWLRLNNYNRVNVELDECDYGAWCEVVPDCDYSTYIVEHSMASKINNLQNKIDLLDNM